MIDNIISAIQGKPDDHNRALYLFSKSTIAKAAQLKENEIPVLELALRDFFMAKTVTKFLRLVSNAQAPNSVTHIDIAKMYLADRQKDTIYARSNYHRYRAGVWEILPELEFMHEVGVLLESLEKKQGGKFTYSQQKSVAAFITQRIAKNDEQLDARPELINMQNGTFNTDTQRLQEHNPDDLLTTQLPFDYDADARAYEWENYLLSTFVYMDILQQWESDIDMIAMIQEAIGYSLTASMKHHVTFWCLGEGSNGKGVLFHVLQALGGSAATAFNLDMLNQTYNTYHIAELAGKRIVYCTEVNKNFDFSGDAMLKAITGGDKIQVRPIREKPFTMESISKVWISFNDFPHVKDTSHGFWRRVKVIPFLRQFDEGDRDINLREKLEAELPGIFNWAMEGLRRLSMQGSFTESEQVNEITKRYKTESNTVEMFVNEACIQGDDKTTLITPIYTAYKEWCSDASYHPYSRKNFSRELEKLKFHAKTTNRGKEWHGLQLKPDNIFASKII